jgi:hypothetical protein
LTLVAVRVAVTTTSSRSVAMPAVWARTSDGAASAQATANERVRKCIL